MTHAPAFAAKSALTPRIIPVFVALCAVWRLCGGGFLVTAALLAIAGSIGAVLHFVHQRRLIARLAWLAGHDVLTGLPNRMMLMEALEGAVRGAGHVALLLIDLDGFKAVNDRLGHPVGDKLLMAVGDRLTTLAGTAHVCARLGGDEFALVVRGDTGSASLKWLAQRVVDCLSAPYQIENQQLQIGASVGAASQSHGADTISTLMSNADLALYQAKRAGRGRCCCYDQAS